MKRLDFNWGEASTRGFNRERYEKALEDLKKYEGLLKSNPGVVTGYWVGMRDGEPYIMVAIEKGKCEEPEKLIPDKLGEYDVYYIEGTIHL
jgi:hypothetical protein